jgi:hypothetical protein
MVFYHLDTKALMVRIVTCKVAVGEKFQSVVIGAAVVRKSIVVAHLELVLASLILLRGR